MIYGFILVMVTMLSTGEMETEAIDWFEDPTCCIERGYQEEENAPMGVGFVCLEDYLPEGDIDESDL